MTISDDFVSSKIYVKRDDFDFDIVNFPFLEGDIPRATSYGVYISHLIRFARVLSVYLAFGSNPIQSGVRDLPQPCCVLEQDTLLPESTG